MAASKTILAAVHHISEHSVFFLPSRSNNLDLKTLCSAPPCHRAVVQRNGLIAKVYAAVQFTDETEEVISLSRREALSLSERQEVWRSTLTYAGLLSDKDAKLTVPGPLQTTPWPFVTLAQYQMYVRQATARTTCTTVNSSSFCIPILSTQEYVYKRHNLDVSLAVLWMPFYPRSLCQWAASFEAEGKPIPEELLFTLLHHLTIAQLTLRSGATIAGGTETTARVPISTLNVDAILVHVSESERDGHSSHWNGEPTFVLSASANDEEHTVSRIASPSNNCIDEKRGLSPNSPTDAKERQQQQKRLYVPPEECNPRLYSTLASGTVKRAVWELGVILYLLASGRATVQTPQIGAASPDGNISSSPGHNNLLTARSPRHTRVVEEVPLNASVMTPDVLWRRLRRDIERRGYHGTLTTVVAQLLSLDPLTRPSLTTVERMLQDLHRPTPIHRFPFALGSYDLLRLPNPASAVDLNPGARRYAFAEVCVLCKKPRHTTAVCSKGGDHQATGITSPSWNDDTELLPGVRPTSESTYATFLYPLCGAADGRQRRKQAAQALQNANASVSVMATANTSCNNNANTALQDVVPLHCGFLLQVFGGFAIYEHRPEQNTKGQVVYKVTVREVLVPYPNRGLRRSELSLVKATLEFGGGLPWPSCCTETLQKSGRVSRHVPFVLIGAHHDVEWFGWVLPGERFAMPNGAHWTAPADGAFVFWFGDDLQPTDRDRYFPVTSVHSGTMPTKVPCTLLPDSLFRQHVGDENQVNSLLMRSSVSRSESQVAGQSSGSRSPAMSVMRRRSIQSVTDIVLPFATHEIVEDEEDGNKREKKDQGYVMLSSVLSRPTSRSSSTDDGNNSPRVIAPSSTMCRHRNSVTRPRCSPSCQVFDLAANTVTTMENENAARGRKRSSQRSDAAVQRRHEYIKSHANKDASPSAPSNEGASKSSESKAITPLILLLPSQFSPPPKSLTQLGATKKMIDTTGNDGVASSPGASPKRRVPSTHGRTSSREKTQPRPHRDTNAKSSYVLSPLPLNVVTTPLVKEVRRQRSRVMMAEKTPHTETDQAPRGLTPFRSEKDRLLFGCSERGEETSSAPVATRSTSRRDAAPKLSPRPSKRTTSPLISAPNSARQQSSGFVTPIPATPKLTPLTHTISALGMLRICGTWLPANVIDATFQALTFWIFSTGEHGYMHAPIKMAAQIGYGLRAPPGAVYLAFLSNQVPLFRRNHPRLDVAVFSPLLPHHGFACYDAEGQLLGALALRCSLRDDVDLLHGEFMVNTQVRDACHGNQISSRTIYASYLTGSVGDEKVMLGDRACERDHSDGNKRSNHYGYHICNGETEPVMNQLLHMTSFNQTGMDSKTIWNTPSDAQTLTFTSALPLVGEFTPNEKDDFALSKESTGVLPACWMGFDAASGSLMFSDVAQSVWVPYSLGA